MEGFDVRNVLGNVEPLCRSTDDAATALADPLAYSDRRRLHAALTHLRASAPVSWVEVADYRPFWAITKHADVMAIERDNVLFTNSPRPFLAATADEPLVMAGGRSLVHLDGIEHRWMRAIAADWFNPRAMRTLKDRVDELAKTYVDGMLSAGPECDFVEQVAVGFPLLVMMSLLGLPESAFPRLLKLTRAMFSPDDNESGSGTASNDQQRAVMDAFNYFAAVVASRREQPTEDLGSAIANARIDGKPLAIIDTLSYFVLFATAGHDTVSSAIAGGLLALLDNPGQFERLRGDLGLLGTATEEMIRWVTPTKQFMRTAVRDTVVSGSHIAAGESVLLSFVSANHDEDVFDEPCRFDVGRNPNKHLGFGHGVHYCLGAALARMEMHSIFTELMTRLKSIELNGDPQHHPAVWVGGLKHLPIRYSPS